MIPAESVDESDSEKPIDGEGLRPISILPPEDFDEAYCYRHDREMAEAVGRVKHDGGIYAPGGDREAFTCRACCAELAARVDVDVEPQAVYKQWLGELFEEWDRGEMVSGLFEFVCEAEELELFVDTRGFGDE